MCHPCANALADMALSTINWSTNRSKFYLLQQDILYTGEFRAGVVARAKAEACHKRGLVPAQLHGYR
jgi:hypothetical protein